MDLVQKVNTRFHDSVSSILLQAAMPASASMATSILVRLLLVTVSSSVIVTYSRGADLDSVATTSNRVVRMLDLEFLFVNCSQKVSPE